MPIGDIHFGAEGFPESHLENTIQWACNRGCYFIGLGDYFDFASETQRSIMSMLRRSSREKIDQDIRRDADDLLKILKPTKGRWLGLLAGNHSWTFEDGTSIEQYLCQQLETDFLGDSALIRLRFDETPPTHPEADVILFCHHGRGAAQTIGGHLLAPEKVLKWLDADLVLMGHDHAKIPAPSDRLYLTPDNVLCHKTTVVARTGGYFKGYDGKGPQSLGMPATASEGSYVEKACFPPSSIGSLCFSLGYEKIDGSKYYRPVIHGSF